MMSEKDLERSLEELRAWFLRHRRDFPWRQRATPYNVWISEVMLQQTRADVVIPYFLRWVQRFPDVHALAAAPLPSVIKAWEGLGYYSRARNLHRTAGQIVREFAGDLPKTELELLKLGGIGPYTASAIAAFAHHQRAVALDGNVLRVLARWRGVESEITSLKTQREMHRAMLKILPQMRPWEIAEALIELGALICKKSAPKCAACPLRATCWARARDLTERLPLKKARTPSEKLTRCALMIQGRVDDAECFFVRRLRAAGVMRDLWEFPHCTLEGPRALALLAQPHGPSATSALEDFGLSMAFEGCARIAPTQWTPLVRHTFTRYRVSLRGLHCMCALPGRAFVESSKPSTWEQRWVRIDQLTRLPFSAGHRQLLHYALA